MSIGAVGFLTKVSMPLEKKEVAQANLGSEKVFVKKDVSELSSFPTVSVLSQMPNVNFKGYNYGKDDLSSYNTYRGGTPPEIEQKKIELLYKYKMILQMKIILKQ